MDVAVLGIDLGKNSCSVVGLDGTGQVILRRRMQRKSIAVLGAKLSPCVIATEACCGAHHPGRVLSTPGHTVRLMPPEYVRPCARSSAQGDCRQSCVVHIPVGSPSSDIRPFERA